MTGVPGNELHSVLVSRSYTGLLDRWNIPEVPKMVSLSSILVEYTIPIDRRLSKVCSCYNPGPNAEGQNMLLNTLLIIHILAAIAALAQT